MKILAVDGNSIMNRAFYGIRPLTTKDGQFTHAIYGFLTMLEKIKADTEPSAVAIAFDLKAPTFRHKEYSGYKATRKGMPPELSQQVEPLKKLLTLLGYKVVSCEGYEADDILGTFAKSATLSGNECVIATGDRDSLQLVSENVTVRLAATKAGAPVATLYDVEKIKEEYSVTPRQLIDIKAIQGDTSDNIPGVAGIGPKGAVALISEFGSLQGVYDNIDSPTIKDGTRNKLMDSRENAFLSLRLGEIFCDVPIDTDINNYLVKMEDPAAAAKYMASLELFKLIEKFNLSHVDAAQPQEPKETKKIVAVKMAQSLADIPAEAVAFAVFDKEVFKELYLYGEDVICKSAEEELFKAYLKDKSRKLICYDSKPIYAYGERTGMDIDTADFDLTLAAYLLSPSSSDYEVQRLFSQYGNDNIAVESSEESVYFSKEYASLFGIYKNLLVEIKEKNQEKLLREIELPLAKVLARM